jgi:hypothetical protein
MEGNDPVSYREISSYLKSNSQTCVTPKIRVYITILKAKSVNTFAVCSAATGHVLYSQSLTLFGVNIQVAGFMTCSQKVHLNAYRILVGKHGGKRQLHRPRFR